VKIFINEGPLVIASGASVLEAVQVFDAALGAALSGGAAYATDGVGRHLDPASPVGEGSIIRVINSAPRAEP
jgi:hypothetical protein